MYACMRSAEAVKSCERCEKADNLRLQTVHCQTTPVGLVCDVLLMSPASDQWYVQNKLWSRNVCLNCGTCAPGRTLQHSVKLKSIQPPQCSNLAEYTSPSVVRLLLHRVKPLWRPDVHCLFISEMQSDWSGSEVFCSKVTSHRFESPDAFTTDEGNSELLKCVVNRTLWLVVTCRRNLYASQSAHASSPSGVVSHLFVHMLRHSQTCEGSVQWVPTASCGWQCLCSAQETR